MYKETRGMSTCVRKDMNNMSFVGLHNTKEGIIAFADSKATRTHNDGHCEEDVRRGKIQKIFKNSNFICVSHGNNELFASNQKMNMEDYFAENLAESNHYDFFLNLFSALKKSQPDYNDGTYHFIIGSRDKKGNYLIELTIDVHAERLNYSDKRYEYISTYGGDDKYVKMYDIVPKYRDIPIDKYKEMIKAQLEHMVQIFDIDAKYNSVGLPINIETFQ